MKKLCLLATCALVFFYACRKQPAAGNLRPATDLTAVRHFLKDSLPAPTYDSLDFSRVVIASRDSGRHYFVRVAFTGEDVAEHFVLIGTDAAFGPITGTVLRITRDPASAVTTPYVFNGTVVKTHLDGTADYTSAISNGYVMARHTKAPALAEPNDPYIELPEIIIYAPEETYYADWDVFISGAGYGNYGYSSSSAISGGGGSGSPSAVNSYSFDVANELQASRAGIDLKAYLNCFSTISAPDETFTAALFVRIPDPNNPNTMWNPYTGNVGHTFVMVSKTAGGQTITQYIGFYATNGFDAITDPTPSKMVDNSGHPYDATLTFKPTAAQFSALLTALQNYSVNQYQLGGYNCTNYALDAFNSMYEAAGLSPISVPLMAIPSQTPGETPNGLYKALQSLPSNGPDGQVSISAQDRIAGASHGACD